MPPSDASPPSLRSVRSQVSLQVRGTEPSDLSALLAAERAPENAPYVGQWAPERHRANLEDANYLYLTLRHGADAAAAFCGYVILEGLAEGQQSVNLKRLVVTDKRRGLGRAAVRHVMRLAFEELGAHRLWLDVKTGNAPARSLYESEGFRLEGTLRDCLRRGDAYESLHVLSLLRPEYEARRC